MPAGIRDTVLRLTSGREAVTGTVVAGLAIQAFILVNGVLAARALGVEGRGLLALYWVVALIVSQLGMLGLPLAATYWIVRSGDALGVVRRLRGTMISQALLLALIQGAILLLLVRHEGGQAEAAALVSVLGMPALIAHQYALAVLLGLQSYTHFNVLRGLPTAMYSVAIVALFVTDRADLLLVTLAWATMALLGSAVTVLVTRAKLRRHSGPQEDHSLRGMLGFGLRGLVGASSPLDQLQLDQAVVGVFLSPAALGLYGVGVSFTSLPRLLGQNLGYIAFPQVAASNSGAAARRLIWRFAALCLILCGLVVLVVEATVGFLVPLLFGNAFREAIPLARILAAAALLFALRRVLAEGARGAGRPGLGTVAEVAAWSALAIALPVLANSSGTEGVAWGLLISSTVGLAAIVAGLALARDLGERPRGGSRPSDEEEREALPESAGAEARVSTGPTEPTV